MNVLSLFDGMSCGRIALQRAGIHVDNYFSSEIDKNALKVADVNWPRDIVNRLGDVTKIDANRLPKIDLLIGGSPCQGFSFAGKQLNFNDPRSKLFFEFVRLLKCCKPKYFLLENSPMKKENLDIISDCVGVRPVTICSSSFSAQSRKRLYWTNIPFDKNIPDCSGIFLKDILESGTAHRKKSKTIRVGGRCSNDRHEWDIANAEGRRYSVNELCRLQTVPDNYCDSVGTSEAYKMLGNGWTVDVIAHILKGITNPNV